MSFSTSSLIDEFPLSNLPPILCIGANPSFQTALFFHSFQPGRVNRAFRKINSIGGKGQNFAIAIEQLGRPQQVAVLQFTGGETGRYIRDVLSKKCIQQYNVPVEQSTRTCTTVLDIQSNLTTDLIEPSNTVSFKEYTQFMHMAQHLMASSKLQAIALCGTLPYGIEKEFYSKLVQLKPESCILLLDACTDVEDALMSGKVTILKINHEEAIKLGQMDTSLPQLGLMLFQKFKLQFLVITDGPQSTVLFTSNQTPIRSIQMYQFHLPSWSQIFSSNTITSLPLCHETTLSQSSSSFLTATNGSPLLNCVGAGDTCSGILLSKYLDSKDIVDAVRYGLSAASASCLVTDSSAHFDPKLMHKIYTFIQIESLELKSQVVG